MPGGKLEVDSEEEGDGAEDNDEDVTAPELEDLRNTLLLVVV